MFLPLGLDLKNRDLLLGLKFGLFVSLLSLSRSNESVYFRMWWLSESLGSDEER